MREKIMCKTVRGVGLTIEELECAALSVGMGSGVGGGLGGWLDTLYPNRMFVAPGLQQVDPSPFACPWHRALGNRLLRSPPTGAMHPESLPSPATPVLFLAVGKLQMSLPPRSCSLVFHYETF